MTDTITLTGVVATIPKVRRASDDLTITSFRLASGQRRFDRPTQKWVDGETNWYTVTAFRNLAINAAGSLAVGDHVVVTGKLRIKPWQSGEKSGINVEVDAESIGHDMVFGKSGIIRPVAPTTDVSTAGSGTSAAAAQPSFDTPAADAWATSLALSDADSAGFDDDSDESASTESAALVCAEPPF